ncbi:AI-2E family transporter [Paludisphaera rhizosphaerae]|uniref:AI-2E family transporter n=1 Tax=Paludisphaera rhizosphaerae TaxID=2711216 RepID=UPI0013EB03B3|nr:AI-2E family transporter [Paludisphaera rhizosphaerae]
MEGHPLSRAEYVQRVLIATVVVAGVAAAAMVFVQAASVFLLAFAAVLLAILLRTAADALGRRTGLGPKWAFAILLVVLALAVAGAVYFVGSTAADQLSKLSEELPKSIDRVREFLRQSTWGREILRWLPAAQDAMTGEPSGAASQVARFFATSFGAAGDAVVLIFVTLYLAGSPRTYVDGLMQLVPPAGRPRAREVLTAVGERLKGWMLGQMVAMATVGVISGIGLKLIGVPQFLVLGLVAGLLTAIPYIGPIVGAVVGVLAALTQGTSTALWAILVFTVAESLEGYVVTPLIQQKLAELPPVLTLLAIALAGVLFGVVGLIVAAPLAVAIKTLVEELYIKDALGDREGETT